MTDPTGNDMERPVTQVQTLSHPGQRLLVLEDLRSSEDLGEVLNLAEKPRGRTISARKAGQRADLQVQSHRIGRQIESLRSRGSRVPGLIMGQWDLPEITGCMGANSQLADRLGRSWHWIEQPCRLYHSLTPSHLRHVSTPWLWLGGQILQLGT